MTLPRDLESALIRILDDPEAQWDRSLDELCAAHPKATDAIRAEAARIRHELREHEIASTSNASDETTEIGPFRILEPLGSGGMGTVYRAEQTEPVRREVALKLIKLGMDSHALIARFGHERQALALMEHEGIAKVFDCGTTGRGQPWFAMELVKGVPIDRYCEERRLTLAHRLELVQQVCAAVQHAHQKGIVHRDLKPGNVLVVEHEDRPQVKIIDFGLAKALGHKLVDATMFTEAGMLVGTPEFMAPEQADPTNQDIDTRADVYAIGVMLYQLLVDALPFSSDELRRAGIDEARRLLREVEPPKPSTKLASMAAGANEVASRRRTTTTTLRRALSSDLDWVVLRAMAKERKRRYETTSALAQDLERYLRNEPVLAGPPSAAYRLWKLWQRRKIQLTAAGLVILALIGGGISTLVQWNRAEHFLGEFKLLSGVMEYGRAVAQESKLYPAWPKLVRSMQRWIIDECDPLLAKRPDVERAIAQLRRHVLDWTDEEQRRDRLGHPRYAEWLSLGPRLESLRYAQRVRDGTQELDVPDLDAEQRALPASELIVRAEDRVSLYPHARSVWGKEALGLAYAQHAANQPSEASTSFKLHLWAMALLANGQIAEALEKSEAADAARQPRQQRDPDADPTYYFYFEAEPRILKRAAERLDGRVTALEAEYAALTLEVNSRRTWTFPRDMVAESFLHGELVDLLSGIRRLEEQVKPSVERRISWAQQIDSLTFGHPNAAVTWDEVRAQVRISPVYEGTTIELRPEDVIGLVPLGPNPETHYQEFYHLRSAWDGKSDPAEIPIPKHARDGTIEVTETTGIVFVLLPGGQMQLGSQNEDEGQPLFDRKHQADELPYAVDLAPFFVARHEVTQAQWARLWTWNSDLRDPSYFKAGNRLGVTLANPVERVDWDMCTTLASRHGLALPTEAQWEYACRGGTTTPWIVELTEFKDVGNVADRTALEMYPEWEVAEAWHDGHIVHAPVGSLAANRFGLHDVHGNVWEWCRDWYGEYGWERAGDGLRSDSSQSRVYRGGTFNYNALYARSAFRLSNAPSYSVTALGMRAARPLSWRPED